MSKGDHVCMNCGEVTTIEAAREVEDEPARTNTRATPEIEALHFTNQMRPEDYAPCPACKLRVLTQAAP
jgi:DNA-directed RNA polymerase subunit RPC12/RpoP